MSVCLHVCLCTARVPNSLRSQERASDPLDLELQRVVVYHVGAGYGTCSSGRVAGALNSGAFSLGPISSVSFVKCLSTVSCNYLLTTKSPLELLISWISA